MDKIVNLNVKTTKNMSMVNVNVPKVQFVADLEHVLVAAMQINSGKMEYVFVFLDMKRIDLEFVFRLL